MRYAHLLEDAAGHLSAYNDASDILHALIGFLMDGDRMDHYGFKGLNFGGHRAGTFLCLRGAQIGLSGEDAALWFRFGEMDGYSTTGSYTRFIKSGEPVITILCSDEPIGGDTEKVAQTIIHRSSVHEVILHELVHYLDGKRNPTILKKGTNSERDGKAAYYNNPIEFNAYATNFTEPLLNFLRTTQGMDASGAARIAKVLKISDDFNATLETLVQHANRHIGKHALKFYQHLRKHERRALMKRIYGLHREVVARLNQPSGEGKTDALA